MIHTSLTTQVHTVDETQLLTAEAEPADPQIATWTLFQAASSAGLPVSKEVSGS